MEMYLIAGFILSAVMGITLGLIGGGGSTIMVPVLVYVMGIEAHQAIGMSLAIVGMTSLIGAGLYYRQGMVKLKTGALFSVSGVIGAYPGSYLTYLLSSAALLLSFAVLMILVSIAMLFERSNDRDVITHQDQSRLKTLAAGLVVGLLTGFLGVGGGFLAVPALVFFCGLSMKDAIGTSLLIITVNCAAGLAGHLRYGSFDVRITMLVTIIAISGTCIGTTLSYYISAESLKKWFAALVVAVAIFLIVKNYKALL